MATKITPAVYKTKRGKGSSTLSLCSIFFPPYIYLPLFFFSFLLLLPLSLSLSLLVHSFSFPSSITHYLRMVVFNDSPYSHQILWDPKDSLPDTCLWYVTGYLGEPQRKGIPEKEVCTWICVLNSLCPTSICLNCRFQFLAWVL